VPDRRKSNLLPAALNLNTAIARLASLYSQGQPLTDPLAILVWENVGYLIDDEKRNELFAEFQNQVGLTACEIASAPMPMLIDIAKRGGMAPQKRAERLKEIGAIAIRECDSDVRRALQALPLSKARLLLKKFPSIGDPGADRILLFAGIAPVPALDSNGLRAIVRMGFVDEGKSYAQTYKSAAAFLAGDGQQNFDWLRRAYLVLRAHGKALCKTFRPTLRAPSAGSGLRAPDDGEAVADFWPSFERPSFCCRPAKAFCGRISLNKPAFLFTLNVPAVTGDGTLVSWLARAPFTHSDTARTMGRGACSRVAHFHSA
jgi:endonuclease-3